MAENRVGSDGKNMWKDALILFATTLISGLLLGLVYQVTAQPRREQQERRIQEACRAVFAHREGKALTNGTKCDMFALSNCVAL